MSLDPSWRAHMRSTRFSDFAKSLIQRLEAHPGMEETIIAEAAFDLVEHAIQAAVPQFRASIHQRIDTVFEQTFYIDVPDMPVRPE